MHVNGIWIAVGREDAQLVPVGIRSITRYLTKGNTSLSPLNTDAKQGKRESFPTYRVAEDNAPERGFTPQSAMDGSRHKDPRCIYLCLFALN